jgi:Flp pilus assembly protein TadG
MRWFVTPRRTATCDERDRGDHDAGSIVVETVFVLPVLSIILVGMASSGLALMQRFSLETAARDAARSGAVLPYDDPPDGTTWTSAIEAVARSHSSDQLMSGDVCIALVDGVTGSPVLPSLTTNTDGSACFVEVPSNDLRVQVLLVVPSRIDAVLFSHDFTISVRSSARYELPRPI